jgi:TolB-like protein/DNA-binding winged helix-turn-helix (wHTH) protein/Flp pilus assembly protein TadD
VGWRFGEAELLEGQPRLVVRGNAHDLDHSSHEVLRCLLEHAGRVVSKDQLLQRGWPGRVVSENSLTKAIGRLRQALQDPDGQLLCTVHGYGYRLAAIAMPVSEPDVSVAAPADAPAPPLLPEPTQVARPSRSRSLFMPTLALVLAVAVAALAWRPWWQSPTATARAPVPAPAVSAPPATIAVLPFVDLSPRGDQRYFGDGLADELLDRLAKVPGLHVTGRTSSFSFRDKGVDAVDIGRRLGVGHVLEGSVRKSGDRIRITAQLIDTRTGFHVWSETYDRAMGDLFTIQDSIATEILQKLELKLMPEQREQLRRHHTASTEAYELFLQSRESRSRGTPDDNRRAVALLERAVKLDPNFAGAYVELGDILGGDAEFADTPNAMAAGKERALQMLDKAIALDPTQADYYTARADFLYSTRWDWAGAQRDLDAAAKLEPGDRAQRLVKQCRLYAALGRLDEALVLEKRLIALAPDYPEAWTMSGSHLIAAGHLPEGRAALEHALKLNPGDARASFHYGNSWLLEGKPAQALQAYDHGGGLFRLTGMAMALHSAGRKAEADAMLDTLVARYAHSGAYQVAQVHAWRGEKDQAFDWLERAEKQRDAGLIYLKVDPLMRALRGDPRYDAWLKRMKLSA